MGDATCAEQGCRRTAQVRGFCRSDYNRRYRTGTLPPVQLVLPLSSHGLTNVDRENLVADCCTCGPGVRIRIRPGKGGVDCDRGRRGLRTAASRRRQWLRREYGISVAEYEAMRTSQGGRCAICERSDLPLCVDHCHATGRVRGLLCSSCNTAIGHLRDDPDLLRRAIRYLDS